jgi:hypothetical protein
MYLLRFLEKASNQANEAVADAVGVEYRLACSGELYNRRVQTCDWRKSDATRLLLRKPLELFVASQPFSAYPQELCARLTLRYITEEQTVQNVSSKSIFLPDEDVIEDCCSVLTLLSRRLITPVAKTRVRNQDENPPLGSYTLDVPMPILSFPRFVVWKQRPLSVLTSMEGQRIIDNAPPPVGVDPEALSAFLSGLLKLPSPVEIVYASRLYRTALELIESRADIAYQLLISTVESLAAVALRDFQPTDDEKLETQSALRQRAKEFGLGEEMTNHLALEACKGQPWLKRKFKKFLLDFVDPEVLVSQDRVFLVPQHLYPKKDDLPKVFGRIYDARSGNLHGALPFPRSVGIGVNPWINARELPVNWLAQDEVPPVAWFERAVSLAVRGFLIQSGANAAEPFVELGA